MSAGHGVERVLVVLCLVLVAVTCVVSSRRIDCTRFVFAPKCRGVAAKRAQQALIDSPDSSINSGPAMLEDGMGEWQKIQYLLRLAQRSQDDSETQQELWDRLMDTRAPRH